MAARDDPHLELEATVLGNISSVIVPSNFPVRPACKQHRHSTNLGCDFCRASFYVILTFYRRESISSLSLCEADSKMGLEMQEVYWRKYLGRIKEGLMAGGVGGGRPWQYRSDPRAKPEGERLGGWGDAQTAARF